MKVRGKTGSLIRPIRIVVIVLAVIGVFVIARRLLFLIPVLQNGYHPAPKANKRFYVPEDGFGEHTALTLVHILPAFLFITLAPLQFIKSLRYKHLRLHKIFGRIVFASGLIIGISALIMSFTMSIGGVSETAATTLFAILFLFSLIKAFIHVHHHRIALHREWMIRAFAIGFAVATVRPIVGIFFATSALTGLTVHDFFGTAFWLGFTLHLIAAEAWINYTRPKL
jgi:uncharacterized membrane protein